MQDESLLVENLIIFNLVKETLAKTGKAFSFQGKMQIMRETVYFLWSRALLTKKSASLFFSLGTGI